MKVLKWLDKYFEAIFLVPATIAMILCIFFQVVSRYFFNFSLAWSEELARYLFIWGVLIAIPFTVTRGRHIRLEILPDAVGPKARFVLDLLFFFVAAGFFLYAGVQSIEVVKGVQKMNQVTPTLEIPKWLCYLSVPVGCFLATLRFTEFGIYRILRFKKNPNDKNTFAKAEVAEDASEELLEEMEADVEKKEEGGQ